MDDILEKVIGFDALYDSMFKCIKGVGWKGTPARYFLHGIEETLKLEENLKNGTYKPYETITVEITYPKPRIAVCIHFRDRVYQRSLNDNIIYPAMTKSFITDNAACQTGKGTDFARDRLDEFLRRYYRVHGNNQGFVLQTDIQGYYKHIRHEYAEACFKRYLPTVIYLRVIDVLQYQYSGDEGYSPGSQMVQIAGISVLSPLDHFVKEQLHVELYIRYMDDSYHIHESEKFLQDVLEAEKQEIARIGLNYHPTKTRIYPISQGIKLLGFTHYLSESGKVYRIISPENVKHEKLKVQRMVALVKSGEMTREKADECVNSWIAHADTGNSDLLIQNFKRWYHGLYAA